MAVRTPPTSGAAPKISDPELIWTLRVCSTVLAATGRLIAAELKLPVKLLDMERHYKQVKDKWIGFRGGLSE